jgi:hypothetical protein
MRRTFYAALALVAAGCNCSTVTMSGAEICDNGRDDDLDGLVDCADPDCFTSPHCFTTCLDACDPGTSLCEGAGTRACVHGTSGCYELAPVSACSGSDVCSASVCAPPPCSNQCTAGDKVCAGLGLAVRCDTLASGCTDWVIDAICSNANACSQGVCVPRGSCTAECHVGDTRCTTQGKQQTCIGNDVCSSWGIPVTSAACASDAGTDGGTDAGTDAGLPSCTGAGGCAPFSLATGSDTQWVPKVAAGPGQFLVTWGDNNTSQIFGRIVDAVSGSLGPIFLVSSGQDLSSVLFNGTDYVVYGTRTEGHVQKVSTAGTLVGDAGFQRAYSYNGTVAFNGSQYFASYFWPPTIQPLDLNGQAFGPEIPLAQYTSTGNAGFATVATDGTDFAVAYYEPHNGDIYNEDAWFQRLSTDGGLIGPRVALSTDAGQQDETALAYGKGTWLAAWVDTLDVHALALDATGTPISQDLVLGHQCFQAPDVVWTGTDFFVSWGESAAGVFRARISMAGQVTSPRTNVSQTGDDPSMAYIGKRGLIVYGDNACDGGVCGRFIDL